MEIHELTSKHRPTNEVSLAGVTKGAGSVLGGVAKQVGQQLLQKQGVSPDKFAGQRVGLGQRPEAALQMNAQLMQQMAKKGQEAWTLTQQQLAQRANPPVASAAYLTPQELEPHLVTLVQQLVGFDYNKNSEFGAAPEVNMGMKVSKDNINKSIDKILKLTKEKPDQARAPLEAAWLELTTKGIGPMQTYAQQAQSSNPTSGSAQPAAQNDPGAAKLTQTLGPQNIAAISQYANGKTLNKTGIPAIDGLLTAAGATLR